MIVLVFAALGGGALTAFAAAPFGLLAAFCAAPFGGSLLALLAGMAIASRRGDEDVALDTTDAQVAALRSVLAVAYPAQEGTGARSSRAA